MKRKDGKPGRRNVTAIIMAILALVAMIIIGGAGSFSHNEGTVLAKGLAQPLQSACVVRDNANKPVQNNNDPLARLLGTGGPCPANVFEFRARLLDAGAKIRTAFVDNRGFHN